jgi:hypothetical protein
METNEISKGATKTEKCLLSCNVWDSCEIESSLIFCVNIRCFGSRLTRVDCRLIRHSNVCIHGRESDVFKAIMSNRWKEIFIKGGERKSEDLQMAKMNEV